MIQQTPEAERFKQQMRDSLQHETLNSRAVTFARHANVYTCGDQDEMVYFIESGQIKLLLLSPEGKECLLAIHSSGDVETDKGIHIWSDDADIAVYFLSRVPFTSDGMYVIPTTGWGKEYVVGSYASWLALPQR